LPAIREGSLLIRMDTDQSDLRDCLGELCEHNSVAVVTLEPVHVHVRRGNSIYSTVTPPHTLVLEDPMGARLCPGMRHYVVAKPFWARTAKLNPCLIIDVIDKIVGNPVGEISLENPSVRIKVKPDSGGCSSLIVLSGLFRHNCSWITGRRIFYDEEYRGVLRRGVETYNRGLRQILAAAGSNVILVYNDDNGVPTLLLNIDMPCRRKYMNLIIDILLDFIATFGSKKP
jgi:hypothetical protein